jgi:1-deoxy-D-xylulose-5-phosphate synthase
MTPKTGTLLSRINSPEDLKKLRVDQLPLLAEELRDFILDITSVHPGHLGSSLGVVELTIALHYVYNTPYDKLIWDVGHQAYSHKILTGRKDVFHTNRKWQGISGFPSVEESEYDAFGTGHSSTSVSAILGMAVASRLKGENDRHHIAVIGDGAITGGMAFEGFNNAGAANADILVILNDNGISIDKSTGALNSRKLQKGSNLFEAMNFKYFGPVDGNNVQKMIDMLKKVRKIDGPKLLHIVTTKGKGFEQAEKQQTRFHAPGRFDRKTGKLIHTDTKFATYQEVFGETIIEMAEQNDKIVAITPAMPTGSFLIDMMHLMPERVYDVGIAEQHAVTFSAGLAISGLKPFCVVYSTFLQRAYDQVIHDVALQKLPVVFCIDRAGLVGEDGATHHGAFDLAYMSNIPDMVVAAPLNEAELRHMMFTASVYKNGPFAIRYPRNFGVLESWKHDLHDLEIGIGREVILGEDVVIVSLGHAGNNAIKASVELTEEGINAGVVDMRFLKPIDEDLLHKIFKKYTYIITLEDGIINGGLGSAVMKFKNEYGYSGQVVPLGIPDEFILHGSIPELQRYCGFDPDSIKSTVRMLLNKENSTS